MDEKFQSFLETVDENNRDFVTKLHDILLEHHCKCDIKTAKSGYLVSYILPEPKRTLASFVFRKAGIKLRIYPEHIKEYESFLDLLPEKMKKDIRKASVCKRMVNPEDCNPKCIMGYRFSMDGEPYEKCRYMAFMPFLNEENNPFIRQFLEHELQMNSRNHSK